MRAMNILQKSFKNALTFLHISQIKTMWFAVESLLYGGRLSLTAMGRKAVSKAYPKHNIKRMDRFLGNIRFWVQLPELYRELAAKVLSRTRRPIILVDWMHIYNDMYALSAAVPCGGRAQVIYTEVRPKKLQNNPRVERGFLRRLKNVLPSHCYPIVVTDAGFRRPWFKDVHSLGWDYCGRIRNNVMFCTPEKKWILIKELFPTATSKARDLGFMLLSKEHPYRNRLILFKSHKKNRHSKSNRKENREKRVSAKEPWLLATSLDRVSPNRITNIYATRMKIEETFRDQKNLRFGWSLRHARSNSGERLEILLLVAAFASLALTIIGMLAEEAGIHRRYQANTERQRRVLSWFVLGKEIVQREIDDYSPGFCLSVFHDACRRISIAVNDLPGVNHV